MSALPDIHVRCLVVGGGPAGMLTGYLLARAGVDVVVLEKHADFNRDLAGDTIHPSTLELLYELGLLEETLRLPHQELREIRGIFNGHAVPIADFSRLPTRCKFIAFMPQWDFLNFLSRRAMHFPTFVLSMQHEVIDLLLENDWGPGVRVKSPAGEREMRADLIIGADGRHSITHAKGKLEIQEFGAPIDVLWMRISKRENDPAPNAWIFSTRETARAPRPRRLFSGRFCYPKRRARRDQTARLARLASRHRAPRTFFGRSNHGAG